MLNGWEGNVSLQPGLRLHQLSAAKAQTLVSNELTAASAGNFCVLDSQNTQQK